MISFFAALFLLILGYFIYGKIIEKIIIPTDLPTPAVEHPDGVDYVPIKTWKAFLIQLLNIAGLGPIFGALAGAIWGPCVFLWIVFGTIFAGAVHDYLSGMISLRHNGTSVSEIVGIYLGPAMKTIMRIFSVVLLIMVGVVFMVGPAQLLAKLTPKFLNVTFWVIIILIYYFLATLLPIDKIIGKIYPIFGICLIVMAVGIAGATLFSSNSRPMMELTLKNLAPDGTSIWPMMFITVACGAISGFHATQSPMVARCLISEKNGRRVFYGAMVAEGVIALIWAAAGVAFYQSTGGLSDALLQNTQAGVVYDMSIGLLGPIGGVLAMIGVIVCPITSGDTAFRSARLTVADWFHIDQKTIKKRLILSLTLLFLGYLISLIDYQIVWRYFSWSNQTLAMIVLWACAAYLATNKKNHWIATIPAAFMSAVCCTYILQAPEGLRLPINISYPIGAAFSLICFAAFLVFGLPKRQP